MSVQQSGHLARKLRSPAASLLTTCGDTNALLISNAASRNRAIILVMPGLFGRFASFERALTKTSQSNFTLAAGISRPSWANSRIETSSH
jgi:hypothetical protein